MSEPALYSPSAKRIVELQDEIDQLKARIAVFQYRTDAWPKLVEFARRYSRRNFPTEKAAKELLKELGELE